MMHAWWSALTGAALILLMAQPALAQSHTRLFDLALGTPVGELPAEEWVDPSCGTDGGPPSQRLASFADFARCRTEARTGLHEVWFIYDDEWEYVARAYGDDEEIRRFSANVLFAQPIVTSLLIDDGGLVQGYRIVTDTRAPTALRKLAHELFVVLKTNLRGSEWRCTSLPMSPGEEPYEGLFLKDNCAMVTEDRLTWLEGRNLRKPGQGFMQAPPEGYFESSTRLEVFALDAVRDAPCCQASALP
jgi:hypothetical protein